ncbi:hypothetical protein GGS23DRAFT_47056 [Durotheca rogersii]|uniref:uncharacterized protein n=1 Tax=Durotheca rogersii TaxID=419775 RepID=UPI0022209E9F|nr:uncharacterized protein GGS23DRAFT_47056 [Durotheca rogersii]KAI5862984.1 hypothetical protein GGS23DRAFT_47056 [Durotheca rogersii]
MMLYLRPLGRTQLATKSFNAAGPRGLVALRGLSLKHGIQSACRRFATTASRLGTQASSGPPLRKFAYPENLCIYHAGVARTTFLACLKLSTLFTFTFFGLVVTPAYLNKEGLSPTAARTTSGARGRGAARLRSVRDVAVCVAHSPVVAAVRAGVGGSATGVRRGATAARRARHHDHERCREAAPEPRRCRRPAPRPRPPRPRQLRPRHRRRQRRPQVVHVPRRRPLRNPAQRRRPCPLGLGRDRRGYREAARVTSTCSRQAYLAVLSLASAASSYNDVAGQSAPRTVLSSHRPLVRHSQDIIGIPKRIFFKVPSRMSRRRTRLPYRIL